MRKTYLAMTAAMLLTACGGGESATNNSIDNVTAGNEADATNYQAEVIALAPGQQNGVFLRAVRDAGLECQEVRESERIDPVKGNPAWRIRCGKVPHIISITKDGTANIVSRTDM
ncbi:hypothetical protein [Sphingomonas sp. LT1P40]|uniref:hypothetical protein n=1 Tax=Alteristakelama amylovorans TaxID=3096166 RepID=UPI002FC7B068